MAYSEAQKEVFDSVLLGLAQQHRTIDDVFATFFDFLGRKTDFYVGAKKDEAKQIMLRHFKGAQEKYIALAAERQAEEDAAAAAAVPKASGSKAAQPPAMTATPALSEEGKIKPNSGNGGDLPNYIWTQKDHDVDVVIPLDPSVSIRGKDIVVRIERKHLHVGIKGQKPFFDGELWSQVQVVESMWNYEDGVQININLKKLTPQIFWACVVIGEPEIDVNLVIPEKMQAEDLGGEDKGKVSKMMFDQRQKALGLPSSDQLYAQEKIKQLMARNPDIAKQLRGEMPIPMAKPPGAPADDGPAEAAPAAAAAAPAAAAPAAAPAQPRGQPEQD